MVNFYLLCIVQEEAVSRAVHVPRHGVAHDSLNEKLSALLLLRVPVDVDVEKWVVITTMVLCGANDFTEHDVRRPELRNIQVVIEHDNNKHRNSLLNILRTRTPAAVVPRRWTSSGRC